MWLLGPILFALFPLVHAANAAASAATLLNATVAAGEIVPLWLCRRTSSIVVVLLGRHRLRDLRSGAMPLLLLQRSPSIGLTTTTKTPELGYGNRLQFPISANARSCIQGGANEEWPA